MMVYDGDDLVMSSSALVKYGGISTSIDDVNDVLNVLPITHLEWQYL